MVSDSDEPKSVVDCLNQTSNGRVLVPLLGPYISRIKIGVYYAGICQTYVFGPETFKYVFSTADHSEGYKYVLSSHGKLIIRTNSTDELANQIKLRL